MTHNQLLIAANTLWVVVAAVLVMFMQAGFAFLEAGLTRMKNAAHIAGKNVLIFGVASLVYWLVGFGLAFGNGNGFVGTHGFAPSFAALLAVGKAPYAAFTGIPGAAGWLFEVVFAGVSLAIVWGAMAERAKLWVYFAFGAIFTVVYSLVSHWIWAPGGWLQRLGMQDFAGSTVVHYQGALAALAGALLLGPRIGKFGHDGRANAIPGHNMPYAVLGTLILWFGWFGFNAGSTLGAIGKFTTCFAEWEERSPWEPIHVERGFKKNESVVTVFGLEAGSRQIADQTSRTARALVGSLGLGLEACWHPKQHGSGEILLVISPEHADTIARDKWSKAQVRARIQEVTSRPIRELLPDDDSGEGVSLKALGMTNPTKEQLAQKVPKFRRPENINIIVAGGDAGKFSAVFAGWVSGPMGSSSVSRRIEEAI